jgi:hypothetical protein
MCVDVANYKSHIKHKRRTCGVVNNFINVHGSEHFNLKFMLIDNNNEDLKRHCQPQCICLHFTLKVMECQQITIINISLVLCRYNSVKMSKYNHRMVEIYHGLKTKT